MTLELKGPMPSPYIKWFDEISLSDLHLVGGKNASLGEMYRELGQYGIKVPYGFAITVQAYNEFLQANSLEKKIDGILHGIDPHQLKTLGEIGKKIRELIMSSTLPKNIEEAILWAYQWMIEKDPANADVAVRSSATAEDLPEASFAGQFESFLHIQGAQILLNTCKKCFASLYTDRAISYRFEKNYLQMKVGLSIVVQRMVRSDKGVAGTLFTLDTESGHPNIILINASYGLGENIVQGLVEPDEYLIFKETLKKGYRPILKKRIGSKELKLIYATGGTKKVVNIPVPPLQRERLSLSDDEVLQLAQWSCSIEDHYSNKAGHKRPMDIEWAKDGLTGEIFIVQARPETVHSQRRSVAIEQYHLKGQGPLLISGVSVGTKIGQGKTHVISDVKELANFRTGDVLVAENTDPDWVPTMKLASAIVTDSGGRTCHAAIVGRELGIPTIVGTHTGTKLLQDGQEVTVVCSAGSDGQVYEGLLEYEVEKINVSDFQGLLQPQTKIMTILADPSRAFDLSFYPNDGVGLLRIEFLISHDIKIHPMALIQFDQLKDEKNKRDILQLTKNYEDKRLFFVDKLAEGVSQIAAAFYPKDVIVRLSDFKTNEYSNLLGGSEFEPKEENPMIGFRGASRYYHEKYREGFALECLAMKKVRDEMGLTNLKIMIPFCRTPEEGMKVLAEMAKHGLQRGKNQLEVYVMGEIPSNVILAKEFSEIFDGFSIGSNDLTQLVLGVDRDSGLLADLFDEENPAVKKMLSEIIQKAHAHGRKIGICGQAPSDKPNLLKFLLDERIDSISVNPDTLIQAYELTKKLEGEIGRTKN